MNEAIKTKVMISATGAQSKPNSYDLANLNLCQQELDIYTLKNQLEQGKTISHIFGFYSKSTPKKQDFQFANCVFVDIDNTELTEREILNTIPDNYQPNLFYQSFSSGLKDEKHKGLYSYHLIYFLPLEVNSVAYNNIACCIQSNISGIVCDKHNNAHTQIFYGTNKEVKVINTKYFDIDINNFCQSYANVCDDNTLQMDGKKQNTVKTELDIEEQILSDFQKLSYSHFVNKYINIYTIQRNTNINWLNVDVNKASIPLPENYFEITYRKGKGGKVRKIEDGKGRKKHLFTWAIIHRLINKNITPEELLFNVVADLHDFIYTDSKTAITKQQILDIVYNALNANLDDYKEKLKPKRKTLTNPNYCAKFFVNKKQAANIGRRQLKEEEIGEVYDVNKSVKENLESLKQMGIKTSLRTLYRFCKNNEINTKGIKENEKMDNTNICCSSYSYCGSTTETMYTATATTTTDNYNNRYYLCATR